MQILQPLGLIAWLSYTAVLGLLYVHLPPSPDLQIFDYIGWVASTGGRLYLDATEQNWPGAMLLHTLAVGVFGPHIWSYRILDYLLMVGAALLLAVLLHKRGARWATWIVVPLYQGMYVTLDLWISGQRDIVAAHMLLPVILAFLLRIEGKSRIWLLVVGLGTLLAVLTRPTYLLFAPILLATDMALRPWTNRTFRTVLSDASIAAAVFLIGAAAVIGYAVSTGAFTEWRAAAIDFNTQIYGASQTFVQVTTNFARLSTSWHWYLAFATIGATLWWRNGEKKVFALILTLAFTGIGSAYAQRKGFGYHLGALVPVLAAFVAYLIGKALECAYDQRRPASWAAALFVAAVTMAGLGSKVYGTFGAPTRYLLGRTSFEDMLAHTPGGFGRAVADAYRASVWIRQVTFPSDSVLVWDRQVAANYLAERKSPTRFITAGMLELAKPPFMHSAAWNSEFRQALFSDVPPQVILAPSAAHPDYARALVDPTDSAALGTLRQALNERYRNARSFGQLDAYVLTP